MDPRYTKVSPNYEAYFERAKASVPEPEPIKEGIPVTPSLLNWIETNPLIAEDDRMDVIDLIMSRDKYGFGKYDGHLLTGNRRNTKNDIMDEIGDAIQYVYKAKMNGEDVTSIKKSLLVLNMLLDE